MRYKKQKVVLATLVSMGFHSAQSASLSESVQECKQINNSLKRLICFDKLAKNIGEFEDEQYSKRLVSPVITSEQSSPIASSPVNKTRVSPGGINSSETEAIENFGLPQKTESNRDAFLEDGKLIAVVTSVTVLQSQKLKVTLNNGQVWHQTSNEKRNLPKQGDTVEVSKGLLKSFFMKKQGTKTKMRVKRVS